jgi:hypothetical protein
MRTKDETRELIEVAVRLVIPYSPYWVWWCRRGKIVLIPKLVIMVAADKNTVVNQYDATWHTMNDLQVDQCLLAITPNSEPIYSVLSNYDIPAGSSLRLGAGELRIHL